MPTGREVIDTIKEAFELFSEMELPLKEREVTIMYGAALPLIGYIERLEAAQPKWISVKDELPKKWREDGADRTLVNYQIYSPRYGVDVGNYMKPAGRWVIMGLPVDDVTHWMPLPEPPKEDNDANA